MGGQKNGWKGRRRAASIDTNKTSDERWDLAAASDGDTLDYAKEAMFWFPTNGNRVGSKGRRSQRSDRWASGINTTSSDNRRRSISDRRRVKIGTHLLKSTDQGPDVAGCSAGLADLISNASISDLVLQRVGVDHVVVLVSYDENYQVAWRWSTRLFDRILESYPCCRHVNVNI
jgi:hypothetical protein